MSAVYQDIQLSWKGKDYTIKPDMRLMHAIEQHFSLARVARRIAQGDVPLSHMATMVAIMLRSAGADVTDDDVFIELMTGDTQAVQDMAVALITAAFPIQTQEGNTKAPARKATSKKPKT